ncbi:MAG: fabH [Frankiales bacterium]|nr:fabH [Frankiales bacterium]
MSRAAVLCGLGAVLPPRRVTNEELAARLDTTHEWIHSRTGISSRHVVGLGAATSDLATEAGRRALASAQGDVNSVDMVVLATATPDHPLPGTAPAVASRLGLTGVPAFDVAAVCSGFIYALAAGAGAISAQLADRVLVLGADVFSTIVDPDDRETAPIFGDGAGAVVLRAGDPAEDGALLGFQLGSDGTNAGLIQVPGGGSRERSGGRRVDPAEMHFSMQGRAVYRHAIARMSESTRAVLERVGWDVTDVDALVGHQANARILTAVADAVGVPRERAVIAIEHVGNTSAASIPLALTRAATTDGLSRGDRVVLTAFGGGLTWGSSALTWPDFSRVEAYAVEQAGIPAQSITG